MGCWYYPMGEGLRHWRRRLQKLRQLSWLERRLLLKALLLLPLLSLMLRVLGFKRVYNVLSRPLPTSIEANEEARLADARTTAAMVQSAVYVIPIPITCLPHSLALWLLLRRQGITSDLRIGVQQINDEFMAHAWVEYAGLVLNDRQDVHARYAAFDEVILPDGIKQI